MKAYNIRMPIAGYIETQIIAESQEKALEMFYEQEARLTGDFDYCEWEYLPSITQGNICSAVLNDMEIEESSLEDLGQ